MSRPTDDPAMTKGAYCGVLTPEQQRVLREHGTEPPRSSVLDKEYREGLYYCVGCDAPLFESTTKFDSGTGWPSFFSPLRIGNSKGPFRTANFAERALW